MEVEVELARNGRGEGVLAGVRLEKFAEEEVKESMVKTLDLCCR